MSDLLFAHLSDPHLGPVPWPGWRALANKRLTGYLSWSRKRSHIHVSQVLDRVLEDIAAARPDHVLVTGDLVNISLPAEFRQARDWLTRLGGPDRVTIVPGNHDAYVPVAWEEALGRWAPYMAGAGGPEHFPFRRLFGDIAVIGVSSAVPMPPFIAAGRIGSAQAERLERELAISGAENRFRLVLIHHPPFAGGAYKRKALLDADLFSRVLARSGAELVLHGHMHVASLGRMAIPGGTAPAIGAPSASALPHRGKDAGGYYLHRIKRSAAGWEIASELRILDPATMRIRSAGRMIFHPGRSPIGEQALAS